MLIVCEVANAVYMNACQPAIDRSLDNAVIEGAIEHIWEQAQYVNTHDQNSKFFIVSLTLSPRIPLLPLEGFLWRGEELEIQLQGILQRPWGFRED